MHLFAVFTGVPYQSDPPSSLIAGYSSLKAVRPHPGRPFFHTQPRSTPGLMPRPPAAQPVHGRTDWVSKYGSRRWPAKLLGVGESKTRSLGHLVGVLPTRNWRRCESKQTLYSYSSELRHFNILFKVFFLNIDLNAIPFFCTKLFYSKTGSHYFLKQQHFIYMDYVLAFYTVNFVTNFLKINWFSFGVPDNILYRFFKM